MPKVGRRMAFLNKSESSFLGVISTLAYCNPFLPERIELERKALGYDLAHERARSVWSMHVDEQRDRAEIARLTERVEPMALGLRARLATGVAASDAELALYEDLIHFLLYHRYRLKLHQAIVESLQRPGPPRQIRFWKPFLADADQYLKIPDRTLPTPHRPDHMLACFFQIRRAFHHIYYYLVGESMPAARLRAAVWQSIGTHDLRRYHQGLYKHMGDITTLVTGPSGTGKELVARAIAQSRYIPFNPETQKFADDFSCAFLPINLSALTETLIESELFGHKRGSFTGAVSDREGYLEACPELGTVFLDEIGDLHASIQVKLLRILETRSFSRLGETEPRQFQGKIIAATNLDLAHEMQAGRFRQDFYFRLCADMVHTPSLQEQLVDRPQDLHNLILFITRGIVEDQADVLAREVEAWIDGHLGQDYPWPGNFRELEQCVRNVMIRKEYHPPQAVPGREGDDAHDAFRMAIHEVALSQDELLTRYYTMAYAKTGSYEEAARLLKIDWRTLKGKIDQELLERLRKI